MAGSSNPLSKIVVEKIFGLSCLHPKTYFIFNDTLLICYTDLLDALFIFKNLFDFKSKIE